VEKTTKVEEKMEVKMWMKVDSIVKIGELGDTGEVSFPTKWYIVKCVFETAFLDQIFAKW